MRYEDLSAEDQKLLNTDLGPFEKEAEARMSLANEMYNVGFNKLASETADNLDEYFSKVAEASEEGDSLSLDTESEKVAQELGAFIEKGYFDGLRKLGQERHDDELAYLLPFLEEKVAAKGAKAMLARFGKEVQKRLGKAKKYVGGKSDKAMAAVKGYHGGAQKDLKKGVKELKKGKNLSGAKNVAKGVGKHVGPYAALAGVGGGAAYAAKKD